MVEHQERRVADAPLKDSSDQPPEHARIDEARIHPLASGGALRLRRVQRRLLARFGAAIVAPGGGIDRRRLGAQVFGKPARLRALNGIVHPEIAARIRARLARLRRRGVPFVLVGCGMAGIAPARTPARERKGCCVTDRTELRARLIHLKECL